MEGGGDNGRGRRGRRVKGVGEVERWGNEVGNELSLSTTIRHVYM